VALELGNSRLLLARECVAAECVAACACDFFAPLLARDCVAAGASVLVSRAVNVVSAAASRACAFDLPPLRTIAFQTKQQQ